MRHAFFTLTLGERLAWSRSSQAGAAPSCYVRQLGLGARLADVADGFGVAGLGDAGKPWCGSARSAPAGDPHGADVLVLGSPAWRSTATDGRRDRPALVNPTQAAVTMAIGASASPRRRRRRRRRKAKLRLAGPPFLEGEARHLEAVVGTHVAAAEQAADRRIVRRRPAGIRVDDAVPDVQPQHLAEDDVALAAGLQRHQAPAFEMHRRLGDARRLDALGRQQLELCDLDLADLGRKVRSRRGSWLRRSPRRPG